MFQALSEVRSENLEEAVTRLKSMEAELHVALDEVESESMRGTSLFEAKDSEAASLRVRVSANEAEISRMVSELESAQNRLAESTTTAEATKVFQYNELILCPVVFNDSKTILNCVLVWCELGLLPQPSVAALLC